jgi:iron(III) transport system ATP-binding protein
MPNSTAVPVLREPLRVAEPVSALALEKSFGDTRVLRGVDLTIPAGSIVSLLGPSGCGKTTLLRSIAGLERPDRGEISIGPRVVSGNGSFLAPERRRVGLVFQDWALFPHLTVERNVAFGLSRKERRSKSALVDDILEMVGLSHLGQRMPAELSGGQQQRVALARALAIRPSVILLDEPYSNLDTVLRTQIRLEVQRLLSRLGITTLFVTHDQEEAFVMGERVAVMFDGVVVQQGRPSEIYDTPASRAVARFIGDANFFVGTADGDKADTEIGPIPLQRSITGSVEVMVRPEYVTVVPGDEATIEKIEFFGHDSIYLIQPDDRPALKARVLSTPEFRPGQRVALSFEGGPAPAYPV